MIRSVGIDFHQGRHRARCLDDRGQPCDGFSFLTTPEGLELFEGRVFGSGANPIIVFEPAGLPWLVVAAYLRARRPDCRLVKARTQKVAALRRYLRGPVKSDRVDALTLAKMPFIDLERLEDIYLPPAEIHALQRLTRQRKRLEDDVTRRKVRIGAIVEGYLPGVRRAFGNAWSCQARAFLRCKVNAFAVVRDGEEVLHTFLREAVRGGKWSSTETHAVYAACEGMARVCESSRSSGMLNEDFFLQLQDEIACEIRQLEMAETESGLVGRRITELYRKLHPSNELSTIPGVGPHTAPIFLATVGDAARFPNQSAFANWEGVVPGARQSSGVEAKGLRMTKAGPSVMRMALYQAGEIARRWDPQLAAVYHRQMVYHGKSHRQAMGAVMSHLGARVLQVLREGRPYELRDTHGRCVTRDEARRLILSNSYVPEDIRRQRRVRNKKPLNNRETATGSEHEAARAPQTARERPVSRK